MGNFLNITDPQDLVLKLYTSDTTPAEATVVGDLTEAVGGGYADVTLTPASWVISSADPTAAAYPEHAFVFSGAVGSVYGYYVVQAVSGALLWAERFAGAPLSIQNDGDEIRVTLKITLE
jgi:hypothetical protein